MTKFNDALEKYRKTLPDDAHCKVPDFGVYRQCPDDCPYYTVDKCTCPLPKN